MKGIKIFGGLIALLLVIVVGVVVFVLGNLNQIVKETVETVGPEVTQTNVLLDQVDIALTEGKGELNDFVIGNPQGFSSPHLLKWDTIRLQIDPASVTSDVVVIKDFTIEGVDIVAEQKGLRTNLQALLDNLDSGASSPKQEKPSQSGEARDVRLMMEQVRFADNSINFVTEKYGSYALPLPSFELSNIGDKTTGLTPEELGVAILKPLIKQAKKAVEERIKGLAKEELEAKLKEKEKELKAKAEAKKEELKAKVDDKKDKLKEKLEGNQDKLKEQEDKLKEKEDELKNKLKGFGLKDR
ncbi:hypothetical protein [Agarilytica rhodophyticola]|uniref:hypothetical protein n=1 Tax=Agarilytica rhodophyticola TaxID=1737490 RepID=UPI000B343714|nr:hypothetical protein [Agarilytica rhodophyticola]